MGYTPEGAHGDAHESLWQMFKDGPTWDGNLVSKEGRSWLVETGLADRADGWNFLTAEGVAMSVSLGFGDLKDRRP